jgi:hypothetical protein
VRATEREDFTTEWETERPNDYRKSSAGLLQLKYIEQQLIIAGRFAEAQEIQKRIEAREQAEVTSHQMVLNDDYTAAKQRLERAQELRQQIYADHRDLRRQEIVQEQERTLRRAQHRIAVAKAKERRAKPAKPNERGTEPPKPKMRPNTITYGTSFAHVARDHEFEMNPLLPRLHAPTEGRQWRIAQQDKAPIKVNAPRVYVPQNESSRMAESRPLFTTALTLQKPRLTGESERASQTGSPAVRGAQAPGAGRAAESEATGGGGDAA